MITLIISVPSLTDNSKLAKMMDSGVSFAGQGLTMIYPMFIVMLATVYAVVSANKLIAAQVDRGSMGYIMVNPIKRNQFTVTQGIFMAGSVVGMFAVVTAVGSVALAFTSDIVENRTFINYALTQSTVFIWLRLHFHKVRKF